MTLLIPYTRFTIKTYLEADAAEQRLAENVESRKFLRWRWSRNHKFFEGQVRNGHYFMTRITRRSKFWLPMIVLKLNGDLNTTQVDLTMIDLMAGLKLIIVLMFAAELFRSQIDVTTSILIFAIVFSILYFATILFFNYEVNKARRHPSGRDFSGSCIM
jgi:hypothetical protein